VEVRVFRDVPLQLPAIGEIDVPDTLADLREGVARAYRERFGGSVETTVNFSDRSPPVVYVTGDVREPGAYPWSRDLTPLRAIAQAGGFTITANVAQVSVIAGDGGDDGAYTLDFSGIYAGEGGPLAEPLRVNDVIVVPATPTFR
jgi:protein involved in polysaccharide export with SLBB domain